MADGVSFKMATGPFMKAMAQREARMPRAAMYAVREAGRVAKTAAKAKAPVLKDPTTLSHAKLQRYAKAGFNTKAAYQGNRPIPGLLKASIHSSKRLKQLGKSEFSLKVGPRGARVHTYAPKIEVRARFMEAGEDAAKKAMPVIAARAFGRVWKGQ